MGKSESLAQELIGAFIKSVLIAIVAFIAMEYAKKMVELYDKRHALVSFQNRTIEEAISRLQLAYTENFVCTTSVARFKSQDCANGLKNFRTELDVQEGMVAGILGTDISALSTLGSKIDELLGAHKVEINREALEQLSSSAKYALKSAMDDLAQEIR